MHDARNKTVPGTVARTETIIQRQTGVATGQNHARQWPLI